MLSKTHSIYWKDMARSLLAFALAFIFALAPVAEEICEVTCAERAGHFGLATTHASPHHHSDEVQSQALHHHARPADGFAATTVAVRAALIGCGHADAVVSESREIVRAQLVSAILTTIDSITISMSPSAEVGSRHSPPVPSRSPSQLRI
jgi:hypothetical protein